MKGFLAEPAAPVAVRIAGTFFERARGLLLRPDPAPGRGLLLAGVRTVHGFGLLRPLDLVYLDAEGRVLDCAVLAPWRIARCPAACHVVEMRRGECKRLRLVPGRLLEVAIVREISGGARPADRWCGTRRGRRRQEGSAGAVVAAIVIAVLSCLAWAAASAAEAVGGAPKAEATAVDRLVGEPRRKRVRKARASLHRDAADGTPARPLRPARARRPRERQAPVEYFVGEPGRHAARPDVKSAQGDRKERADARR